MRVALLTNFIPPYRIPVLRALRERVGELRVFVSTSMEGDRQWTPEWADLDVVVQKTVTLRRRWQHARFSEGYELHVPYDTMGQLRKWRPDAVITAEFGARTIQAVMYARAAGIPVIVWATLAEHLEASRGRMRALARRGIVRAVNRVIVNGENGARYIRGLGYPDDRIARIAQTTDVAMFGVLPLERPGPMSEGLFYAGSMSERKGVGLLLDGLEICALRRPDRNLAIVMVGEGPERLRLQQRVLPGNLHVQWAGAVNYDELPDWYARASVAIFPTLGDEWGLVVNEAMAAGVPVLGSEYAQAVEELIVDEVNGWRFQPDSAEAVAAAIDRVLACEPAALFAMRGAARQTALLITSDGVANRIATLVEGALRAN